MEVTTVKSWKDAVSFLQGLKQVDLACRGEHGRHARVIPKLDRCLKSFDATGLGVSDRLRIERAMCQRFREHASMYLSPVETQYLASPWLELVVMQHYGAPTRLLDWTKSPWVALFFAVSGGPESDGVVYGFDRRSLEEATIPLATSEVPGLVCGPRADHSFPDEEWDLAKANSSLFESKTVAGLSNWVVTYYCRVGHFPRLVAQQGFFTYSGRPDTDHWDCIVANASDSFTLSISAEAKPSILRGLNTMGLNAATLFPGIEGVGRSLEGFARAWHLFPRPSQF